MERCIIWMQEKLMSIYYFKFTEIYENIRIYNILL